MPDKVCAVLSFLKTTSTPEKLVETILLQQGFIALESPTYFIKDGSGYGCRWHKA
jgi:hypothetical protein